MATIKRVVQVIVIGLMLGAIMIGLAGTLGASARTVDHQNTEAAIGAYSSFSIGHPRLDGPPVVGRVIGGQAGWRVQATDSSGRVVAETIVEGDGRYAMPPLSSGVYRLVVLNMDGERVAVIDGEMARIDAQRFDQIANYNLTVRSSENSGPTVIQANGYITGVITAANTGLPVQAAVAIYTAAGQYQTTGYNEAATGVYSVSVSPGSYKLWFYPFDTYVPEYYNNQSDLANADPVTVNDSAVTANINAVVDIGGWITGTVTAEAGSLPLAFAPVYVYTGTTSAVPLLSTSSDADGHYLVDQLPTGNYYVCFNRPSGENYLNECYNNQASLATANPVAVTAGLTTTNVSAALATGGEILGTVTDAGSGDPLASVSVVAYTSTTSVNFVAFGSTDGNGDYVLNGLPTGYYYLKFEPPYDSGYLTEFYNDESSLAVADPVAVTAGSATNGVDAALLIGGRITGRVTAVVGDSPIGNVAVRVYTSTIGPYAIQSLQTDAAGYYTATTLPTGNYYLEFDPPFATEYLEEFYNDQSALAQANPVAVTAGMTTTSINAALATGGRIAGRVTAVAGGGPVSGVGIYVYTSTTSVNHTFFASPDAGGYYTVTRLPTANYYVKFNPSASYLAEYYNDKPDLAAADPIAVTAGNTTGNINAALSSPGSIAGTVTAVDGGAPLQNVQVNLYTRDNCGEINWVKSAYSNAAGSYTLSNVSPGSYVVFFDTRLGPKLYLAEYYNNKVEYWQADPITVTIGQAVTNVDAALQRGGYITGQITAADGGAPLANVGVSIYDSQGRYKGAVSTNASGVYTSTALISGAYRLLFSPYSGGAAAAYLKEYYSNKSTLSAADPISVTVGNGTPNINAVLDRGGQISGRVTGNGGIPLQDVYVEIYDANENYTASGYTDAGGYYTTTGLIPGNYRAYFNTEYSSGTAANYAGEYYNDKVTVASADPIAVIGTSVTTGINATLAVGGRISGKITVEGTGLPLPDTYVEVYGADDRYVGSSYSDSLGNYTTNALASGAYRVRFYDVWVYNPATCNYTRHYGVYYNQQPTLAAADPVTVTAPSTFANINAALSLTPIGLTNKVYVPLIRR